MQVPKKGRDRFKFEVEGTSGNFDVLVLASVKPLRNALKGLAKIQGKRGEPRDVRDPEEMINGLLGDLTNASRSPAWLAVKRDDVSMVDMNALAALKVTIDVGS